MPHDHPIFLAHVAATLALVGLIWVVQLVIYPQFMDVAEAGGRSGFRSYHDAYTRRITWIVGPLIAVEGLSALVLVSELPLGVSRGAALFGLALAAFNFISTGLAFAPLHGRLGAGYERNLALRLIRGNWVRTAAWSVRGILVLSWIA